MTPITRTEWRFDLPNGLQLTVFDESVAQCLEDLRRDAKRYRWLKSASNSDADHVVNIHPPSAWDELIDAAMKR